MGGYGTIIGAFFWSVPYGNDENWPYNVWGSRLLVSGICRSIEVQQNEVLGLLGDNSNWENVRGIINFFRSAV